MSPPVKWVVIASLTINLTLAAVVGFFLLRQLPKNPKITPPPVIPVNELLTHTFLPSSSSASSLNSLSIPDFVSQLLEVPLNDPPTVATVKQSADLKNNSPFFKDARDDDYILVYMNSKKAVLFRPSTRKIIDIAPIIVQDLPSSPLQVAGASTSSAAPSPIPTP